jgi:DNA polymerase V
MTGAGVDDGDIIMTDKSLEYKNGALAVCCINGGFVLKRIKRDRNKLWLISSNPEF